MVKTWSAILLGTIINVNCLAQFSPPGLGEANTASWFAIGMKQHLNETKTVTSATHLGLGRISNPDAYNPFEKSSIYVVNEEVTHQFRKNWKYSAALSYRWQNKYKDTPPYDLDTPNARQELRIYSRFSYLNSLNKMDYSFSYRPELRFFYDPDFSAATKNTQFRSRFRAKAAFNLNALETHKISTTAEAMFSTTRTNSWSTFEYQEIRFCLYYSITFPKQKLTFNLGYMNDLIGKDSITDVHYFAFDIMINHPFSI
ncbi:DUF2490 domain-containing protein [Zobellia barbeyronii]|uniref:DUF2490 domain-containing protein n=1 Tax=Zobellia barbeyronii TaxID=2748009 RepID=A0ABS5WG22_9FLAO|nr:DUF2490 domain-containing protein [Zobellia barbeyronii]MBT2162308.1 DUF2490 domain-containing protein [Zobellia barbeyronii]